MEAGKLRSGKTKSCGCYARDKASEWGKKATRHGHAGKRPSRTYQSWIAMRNRCYREKDVHYASYGGRGITVCGSWRASFEVFLADMGERPEGKTLDRIDPDGNYEPGNCRWATPVEQRANWRKPV